MHINFSFAPPDVCFLGTTICIRVSSVLSLHRCIYIFHDVIFNKKIFPFASLDSKTGAQYTAEFLLLAEPIPGNNTSSNTDESSSCFLLPVSVSDVQQQASELPPQASGELRPHNQLL
jgi:hypothetical protein